MSNVLDRCQCLSTDDSSYRSSTLPPIWDRKWRDRAGKWGEWRHVAYVRGVFRKWVCGYIRWRHVYARTYVRGIKEFLCLQNNILFIIWQKDELERYCCALAYRKGCSIGRRIEDNGIGWINDREEYDTGVACGLLITAHEHMLILHERMSTCS
jgi:hypothetical protein